LRLISSVWLFVLGGIVIGQACGWNHLYHVSDVTVVAIVVVVTAGLAGLFVITNRSRWNHSHRPRLQNDDHRNWDRNDTYSESM
jgi:hypothetical protein